ncbi:hypothetical protein ACLMJK_006922 [Lecanora helva]
MEVAGGAIGAVALGIQLVGTVQKVTTFIKSIHDTPEDLAYLASSVDQLETTLRQVTTLVENRSQHTDTPGSVNLLESAVRNCEPNVTKLDETSNITHPMITPHSDPILAHGEREVVQDIHPTSTSMVCGQKRGRRNVVCTTSITRIYEGFFGHVFVKKKTTHLRGEQKETTQIGEEVVYLLRPSFLRMAIEMNVGGKLSRSLRYCPILPKNSEIFQMCRLGDLEGFRGALSRQEVPLHAQNERGSTLLHMACEGGSLELCSLIIELGIDASHENIWGEKALHVFSIFSSNLDHGAEAMVRLMIQDQEHLDEHDILRFCNSYNGPPEGFDCILSPDVHPTELDWKHLPLQYLMSAIRHFARDVPRWTNFVRKIVRQAEDLHRSHIDPEFPTAQPLTLLDQLLVLTKDPVEGAQVAEAWLEILAMEGLDVREYLKVEMELHEDNNILPPWVYSSHYDQRILIFYVGQKPYVEWDWWIDPDEPGGLVCDEFRHMACRYDVKTYHNWAYIWPFVFPEWARVSDLKSLDPAINRSWKRIIDLADSRAARRVAKKEMNVARAEGRYSRKRMPGSWIN